MNYDYVSTLVLPMGVDATLHRFTNADQPVWELIDPNQYRQIYIEIKVRGDSNTFYIRPNQIVGINGAVSSKLSSVLSTSFADNFFSPEQNVPTNDYEYARYFASEKLNYQTRLDVFGVFTSPVEGRSPTDILLNDTPLWQMPDILMTDIRYVTDVASLNDNAVITVNGLAHQTIKPNDSSLGLYIKDGGKTANISGGYRVGMIDFSRAGGVKIVPLSQLTHVPRVNGQSYGLMDLGDIPYDITDCQVLLSLAGYIIFPSTSLLKVNNSTVNLDLTHIDLERKIVEASKYIDLSALGLGSLTQEQMLTDTHFSLLHTAPVIEAVLNLSQSFLIIVPRKRMLVYGTYFRRFEDDRQFQASFDPTQLIASPTGKTMNYFSTYSNRSSGWQQSGKFNYTVSFLDLQQVINNSTSLLYPALCNGYPKLVPDDYDIVDYLVSVGFQNDP